MNGAENAKAAIVAYLQSTMAARCTALEVRLSLTTGTIKPPATYSPTDLPDLTTLTYPVLIAEALDVLSMTEEDLTTGSSPTFRVRYPFRVHLMARGDVDGPRGPDIPATEKARDRLILAARELLLLKPTLNTATCRLERNSLTERYLPIAEDQQGRPVSPGWVAGVVDVDELLDVTNLAAPPLTLTVVPAPLTP